MKSTIAFRHSDIGARSAKTTDTQSTLDDASALFKGKPLKDACCVGQDGRQSIQLH